MDCGTSPLLTIAIPTYNRCGLLDEQLSWLASVLADDGRGEVEVLLSDNCSTDGTPAVIDRWRPRLGESVTVQRHAVNIGAVRNIASCLRAARGRHVWVVSDDDRMHDDALGAVLRTLRQHPDLALMVLNFSSRQVQTGKVLFERCFDVADEDVQADGHDLFARCVEPKDEARWGGAALTTALVYRTDLVAMALDAWPDGLDNLVVQLYWTGVCAAHGPACVTRDAYLECRAGDHHFQHDPLQVLKLRSADASDVFARLAREGIAPTLMLRKVVERPRAFARMLVRCGRHWPGPAVRFTLRWAAALVRATWAVGRAAALGRRSLPASR